MPRASASKPAPAKRFEARLERMRSRLNWVVIHVPFDAARVWGLRGQIRVKGEINGFDFRTSLFPTGEGRHYLLVNKGMQRGAGVVVGGVARFQMQLDTEERTVTIPDELKRILGGSSDARKLRRWYDGLNHSSRDDIAKWIAEPKGAEARLRRADQIAERLMNVLEAERDLPPVLQLAFSRHPRAREGWDAMSLPRRRGHLFGIFYYRSPDAQGRRMDKMLQDAITMVERMNSKAGNRKEAGRKSD